MVGKPCTPFRAGKASQGKAEGLTGKVGGRVKGCPRLSLYLSLDLICRPFHLPGTSPSGGRSGFSYFFFGLGVLGLGLGLGVEEC